MKECKSCDGHDRHLCKLTGDQLHQEKPDEYMGLVKDPQFVCKSCGRVAAQAKNLCSPVALGTWEE